MYSKQWSGEVGGVEEYDICQAIKSRKITKPLVAWCMGTCAKVFPYEVQFGHAGRESILTMLTNWIGASAHGASETAEAKNKALAEAGAVVPSSFEEFGSTINKVYRKLVAEGMNNQIVSYFKELSEKNQKWNLQLFQWIIVGHSNLD